MLLVAAFAIAWAQGFVVVTNLTSGTFIQVQQSPGAQVQFSTLQSLFNFVSGGGVVNAVSGYGADPTDTKDSTAAINALLAYTTANQQCAYFPPGTYKFTAGLTALLGNNICIFGASQGGTVLSYEGSSTTADLMTLGNGTTTYIQANLSGFRFASKTKMTAGAALHLKQMAYVNVDLIFDGKGGGNGDLYNGIYADGSSIINMESSSLYVSNDGEVMRNGVEFHANHSVIAGNGVGGNGIHVAGGYGGVYTEQVTQNLALIGLLVDNQLSTTANTQLFVSPDSVFDTNISEGCYLNDTHSTTSHVAYLDGWFASSSAGSGCAIVAWAGGTVNSGVGKFVNNSGDGIVIGNDSTVTYIFGADVHFYENATYAIAASAATTIFSLAVPNAGSSGGAGYGPDITNTAVTCASGSPSSSFQVANGVVLHC